MAKYVSIVGISVFFILGLFSLSFCDEQLTITTYYPSPYGSYAEIKAQRMAIGDAYIDSSYCWGAGCGANVIDANADLVVQGNVGIGTPTPGAQLHIYTPGSGIINEGLRLAFDSSASTGSSINWRAGAGATVLGKIESGWDGSTNSYMGFSTYKSGVGTTEKMRITREGTVGIGETNPSFSTRLTVKGLGASSATSSLNITDSAGNSILYGRDDGNVGIGTTSPSGKLTVLAGAGNGLVFGSGAGSTIMLSQPNVSLDSTRLELDYDNNGSGLLQIALGNRVGMQLDYTSLFANYGRVIRALPGTNVNPNPTYGVGLNPIRQDYAVHPEQTTVQPPQAGDITWFGAFGFLGYDGTKWVSLQASAGSNTYTNSCPLSAGLTCSVACNAGDIPLGCTVDPAVNGRIAFYRPVFPLWGGGNCWCYNGTGLAATCHIGCFDATP